MKKGYIYIITNKAWPEYVKIGRTHNTKNRLKSYQTSSPFRDYEIYYEVYTENICLIENIFIKLSIPLTFLKLFTYSSWNFNIM